MRKWARLAIIVVAMTLALLPSLPVFADTIPLPAAYSINSIEAYRHVVELDDQLYLVRYTINYATTPGVSTQDAWKVRLTDATTELGTTVPYAFHYYGYTTTTSPSGIVAIYFSVANPPPAWEGDYTVRLEGDPLLSWAGGVSPATASSTFSKWSTATTTQETSVELELRIRYIANELSTSWGVALLQSGNLLTETGENYFEEIFPNLRLVCPNLFESAAGQPVPDIKTENTTAADTAAQQLVGTPFDTTGIANWLHISRMWTNGLLWTVFWLGLTSAAVWKLKATRIALFIFGFAMIGGAVTGWMGWQAGAMCGVLGALAIVYAFLWRGAG